MKPLVVVSRTTPCSVTSGAAIQAEDPSTVMDTAPVGGIPHHAVPPSQLKRLAQLREMPCPEGTTYPANGMAYHRFLSVRYRKPIFWTGIGYSEGVQATA